MAASSKITIGLEVNELGADEWDFIKKFSDSTTPTRKFYNYLIQATVDTDEALSFGDVGTVTGLLIHAVDNDVDVDLDYVSTFDVDLTIPEGEWAYIPNPAGVVRIDSNGTPEQVTIEVWAWGTA